MIQIDNSLFKFTTKIESNVHYIFDEIRRKWIVLTPEEWVRQNFIQCLTIQYNFPKSLIAIEKEIKVNQQRKRFDIVVYKNEQPFMLVECKQPQVQLNDAALQQLLSYNSVLQTQYFVVTNGSNTVCIKVNDKSFIICDELPKW